MDSPLHTHPFPFSAGDADTAGTPEMKSGADVGPGSDIFQRLLKERIEADSDRDRWFTAEEAREYGFIDEVIQKDAMQVPAAGSGSAT